MQRQTVLHLTIHLLKTLHIVHLQEHLLQYRAMASQMPLMGHTQA